MLTNVIYPLSKGARTAYYSRTMANQSVFAESTIERESKGCSYHHPNNLSATYANHMGVSATMTDFTIYFLEMGQIPGPKGTVQKQEMKAVVTLPIIVRCGIIGFSNKCLETHKEN